MKRLCYTSYESDDCDEFDDWIDVEEHNDAIVNSAEEPFTTSDELIEADIAVGNMAYVVNSVGDYQDRFGFFVYLDGEIVENDNCDESHFDILQRLAEAKVDKAQEEYNELYNQYIQEQKDNDEDFDENDIDYDDLYDYMYNEGLDVECAENQYVFRRHENGDGVGIRPNGNDIVEILNVNSVGFGAIFEDGSYLVDKGTVGVDSNDVIKALRTETNDKVFLRYNSDNGWIVERVQ